MSNINVLALAAQYNVHAWEELLKFLYKYLPKVANITFSNIEEENRQTACFNTLYKILHYFDRWDPDIAKFTTWINVILKRSLIDEHKKERRKEYKEISIDYSPNDENDEFSGMHDLIPRPELRPYAYLKFEMLGKIVFQSIIEIKNLDHRNALLLAILRPEYPQEASAALLGANRNTYVSRRNRAIQTFRKLTQSKQEFTGLLSYIDDGFLNYLLKDLEGNHQKCMEEMPKKEQNALKAALEESDMNIATQIAGLKPYEFSGQLNSALTSLSQLLAN